MKNKRVSYWYMFNYFGGDKHDGKVVGGASVELNIRPYKNGEEVFFRNDEEIGLGDTYLNDVFDISFDREQQYVVKKNQTIYNMFCNAMKWDRIEADVTGYTLDVYDGVVGDEKNELPAQFQDVPILTPVSVSEQDFRNFISSHADDFDISDNQIAQVPGVEFFEPEWGKSDTTYYILDHRYVKDHKNFCRVVQFDNGTKYYKAMYNVAEMLVAIQFYFEENVDEHEDPVLDDVIKLLEKYFGFKVCDRESAKYLIESMVDDPEFNDSYTSFDSWQIGNKRYIYLDLYQIRERLCGPGQPEKLFGKWLKPEIMEDIKKMRVS